MFLLEIDILRKIRTTSLARKASRFRINSVAKSRVPSSIAILDNGHTGGEGGWGEGVWGAGEGVGGGCT